MQEFSSSRSPFLRATLVAGSLFAVFASLSAGSAGAQTSLPAQSRYQPAANMANPWQWASFPVENFRGYSSGFGYRQSPMGGPSQEFHYGLDIAAPEGSYIRNWWQGEVVEIINDARCGVGLAIQSGDWEHIYCHMKGSVESHRGTLYLVDRSGGLQIRKGQVVAAGTRIGRVGMSGRTNGPHLHWGLKYGGQWVDPAVILRAMYDSQRQRSLPSSW
ncbi:M23 family metallopeptidase [Geitlerinema sp. PCC 9228]|jgi:murein DD-endopeptidase MepM/ murein hydrolase activator NlpD|uniref:M23 family metallopeptidase n=1 Tax=Geitlerinema sp. PCC 9228 TaxID=111611 RepID=UPI0008F98A93|nr:M23 family metallopeptidase [Geitlerinema sp. PCC 9228]